MDFADQIKVISEKVSRLKDQILTEEATKNAFIMPFIASLGYDVFNPTEVVPEYVADLGIKKGEKVDYCILKDGQPIILVECKWHGEKLDVHSSQLHRYFHVTTARFAILTNGIQYRFYTDLETPNKMDDKPFMEFSMSDLKDNLISELKKFTKSAFNIEEIVSSASELKYLREVRSILNAQFLNPDAEFVRFFVGQIYTGLKTPKIIEQFTPIIKKSLTQFISDSINERLKSALATEARLDATDLPQGNGVAASVTPAAAAEQASQDKENKIVTTPEEMEAFFIIKSILRNKIRSQRITFRDAQSYFAVILDDSNRKTLARLYLNGTKKYLALFNEEGKEVKNQIESLEDIYNYSQQLIESTMKYPDKPEKAVKA